ncbi:MAG: helix-turn-helix domain-containing protein [Woeseiaceae bacterium]
MSDAKDKSKKEASEDEPEGPLGGERLADARRLQQISVLEIAKELHLDEPKVRALERNEFDVLGAPVFAKGHLRKYAQLVHVDEDDVMADYYQLNRAGGMPPLVSARPRARKEMSPGPWIAVIVVVIVVATAYWWFTSPPSIEEPQSGLIPEETTPPPEQEPVASDVDDSAILESVADEPEATVAEPVEAPVLDDGQVRVLVSYSGDCWTEITDAKGRRLFFGMGTDGRTVELSGEAPFNVLFGNAGNASIRVNGSERAIADEERRGRTARFTIPGT